MGRHIAGNTRVGVLPPCPAMAVCLLVASNVGDSPLAQLDRTQNSRHPCTNDDGARIPFFSRALTVPLTNGPDHGPKSPFSSTREDSLGWRPHRH
jgi:hypothetical protein